MYGCISKGMEFCEVIHNDFAAILTSHHSNAWLYKQPFQLKIDNSTTITNAYSERILMDGSD